MYFCHCVSFSVKFAFYASVINLHHIVECYCEREMTVIPIGALVILVRKSGESKMKDYEKKVNLQAATSLRRRSRMGELLRCFLCRRK